MEHYKASLTAMDWRNVKAFVAKEQQKTAGDLGTAAGCIGMLCLMVSNAPNWGWWAFAMWIGIWWVLRGYDKRTTAAERARDEMAAQHLWQDTE